MPRLLFLISIILISCASLNETDPPKERMDGLSFVAPPYKFKGNPMEEITAIGANYISVIPIAYTRPGKPSVRYDIHDWQWWGERPEGVRETIDLANASNINVLLKPQVYVPGSWPGGLDFSSDEDWKKWEQAYRDYILPMAKIAEAKGVKVFCIGTEFKISSQQREQFWRDLIKEIRALYSGKLTYAANWDEYKYINFWDELDYIGIDAYFPLNDATTPKIDDLIKAWEKPVAEIEQVQQKFKKPVIFTEYGYMSVDGCAGKVWEIEPKIHSMSINQQAQSNAIEALHQVFFKKDYWAGGFIWKWFPEGQGHEGYPAKDYTPQDKLAAKTLKKCFEM